MAQGEKSFQYTSYLELWRPFCSVERNHLDNGHFEEHFCEIPMNFDLVSGGDVVLRYFLSRAEVAILFSGAEHFRQYKQRALLGTVL